MATTALPTLTADEIGELHRRQTADAFQLQHGHVGSCIRPEDGRDVGTAIVDRHLDAARAVNDVVVGDDLPVRGGDHARPLTEVGVNVDHGRVDGGSDLGGRERLASRQGRQSGRRAACRTGHIGDPYSRSSADQHEGHRDHGHDLPGELGT